MLRTNDSNRRRVLLVDDDEHCHAIYGTALEFYGFDVDRALNGIEAVERAREQRPDVILMDIEMPELDGISALRQLRAEARTSVVPVVAVTGKLSEHEMFDLLDVDFDDVVLKPAEPMSVVAAARKWARLGRTARRARSQ